MKQRKNPSDMRMIYYLHTDEARLSIFKMLTIVCQQPIVIYSTKLFLGSLPPKCTNRLFTIDKEFGNNLFKNILKSLMFTNKDPLTRNFTNSIIHNWLRIILRC